MGDACWSCKDKSKNTPLHHVLYFVGCIVVSGSSEPAFHGCYFPFKNTDGRLSYCMHGMDGAYDHFIRLSNDDEELQWRFEDNSDNWFWPFITKGKQSPDEVPTDKCWKACESTGDLPTLIYRDVEDRMHGNVVRALLQFKADILRQNVEKRTPLQWPQILSCKSGLDRICQCNCVNLTMGNERHACLHRQVSRASRDKLPRLALHLLGIYYLVTL